MNDSTTNVTDVDIACAGVALTAADFDNALNKARASYSDSIGAPKVKDDNNMAKMRFIAGW